jgi:hypothetical protein
VRWKEIANDEFVHSANSVENKVRVLWSRNLIEDTKTREYTIKSKDDWNYLHMGNSYLPKYKQGKSWNDPTSQNYTLYEYTLQAPSNIRNYAEEVLKRSERLQITSAYHSKIEQRLIVDGVHRAVALQLKINSHENISEVRLLECYGIHVDKSFPSDLANLVNSLH